MSSKQAKTERASGAVVQTPVVVIDFTHVYFESGYWNGLRQPVSIFKVRFPVEKIPRHLLSQFDQQLNLILPNPITHNASPNILDHVLLSRLVSASISILEKAKMPVMSAASAVMKADKEGQVWIVGLPAVSAENHAPKLALNWAGRLLNALSAGVYAEVEKIKQELTKVIEACRENGPAGVNTLAFLRAAYEVNMPWRHVANNVYQFGWGSRARWLDSTFTDETSRVSAGLARDKLACNRVLREAGLPVARQSEVRTVAKALEVAEIIGYPVVVKPLNLDGGSGVFTHLCTQKAVQNAYHRTEKFSKRILVEKHFEGQDYRLQVYRGKVFWVAHRRPAYVKGDGKSSVQQLIDTVNAQRINVTTLETTDEMGIAQILVDDEVLEWLDYHQLERSSVPEQGRIVRLRGAANVASGGTREAALHLAHPDNLALAVRAAEILRLDLAGVDMLIPDISRSWLEVGAIICEVNAQPQLSGILHKQLLQQLVLEQGRIPLIAVASTAPTLAMMASLTNDAQNNHFCIGLASATTVSVDGAIVSHGLHGLNHALKALLIDPKINAIVIMYDTLAELLAITAVDKFDVVVLAHDAVQAVTVKENQFHPVVIEWMQSHGAILWYEEAEKNSVAQKKNQSVEMTICSIDLIEKTIKTLLHH